VNKHINEIIWINRLNVTKFVSSIKQNCELTVDLYLELFCFIFDRCGLIKFLTIILANNREIKLKANMTFSFTFSVIYFILDWKWKFLLQKVINMLSCKLNLIKHRKLFCHFILNHYMNEWMGKQLTKISTIFINGQATITKSTKSTNASSYNW
jgi:hypothetical protein